MATNNNPLVSVVVPAYNAEKYLQKVLALRKRILDNHEEMVFVDRDGKEVSRRKF
ncbi:MAG: glycosyltransferase [Patescibacteria group bacterium]